MNVQIMLLWLLGLAGFAGYILLLFQVARQQQQISTLTRALHTFNDASINLARTVERTLVDPTTEGVPRPALQVSSRRWVVKEAQARIAQGQFVADLRKPLCLSEDEIELLRVSQSVAHSA